MIDQANIVKRGAMSADAILIPSGDDLLFWCPGCECMHFIRTQGSGPRWTLTGPLDRPTVVPSILRRGDNREVLCHLFVKDGQIQYLADSSHALAGQTVPMVPPP